MYGLILRKERFTVLVPMDEETNHGVLQYCFLPNTKRISVHDAYEINPIFL